MATDLNPWFFESMGVAGFGELEPEAVLDEDSLTKAHDDWIEHIKKTVPKHKLLIHKSADGYGPICQHLGVPPEKCPTDYPNINDSYQMRLLLSGLISMNYAFWPALLLAIFLVFYFVRSFLFRS